MMDLISSFHTQIVDPDRLPVMVLAMALVAMAGVVTGPMHGNANPFSWLVLNKAFGSIGARLDRKERTKRDLLTRGLLFTVFILLIAGALGLVSQYVADTRPLKGFTEILLLSLTLTGGTVWYSLLKLYFALRQSSMGKHAYYIIAHSTRTNLSASDDYTITRTGMSFGIRSFDKGIVAPLIWYLLAGLPGAYLYAAIAWLAWRFGKEGHSNGFGDIPLGLEKILGFAPSALTAILVAFGGLLTPTGGMSRSIASLLSAKKRSPYEEGGLPLTALAYALDVSLGGPTVDLDGHSYKRQWTGPDNATAQLESNHLRRALYLLLMAFILFLLTLLAALLYAGNLS